MVLTCKSCETNLHNKKPCFVIDCGCLYHEECLPAMNDVCQTCYKPVRYPIQLKLKKKTDNSDDSDDKIGDKLNEKDLKLMIQQQKLVNKNKEARILRLIDDLKKKKNKLKLLKPETDNTSNSNEITNNATSSSN